MPIKQGVDKVPGRLSGQGAICDAVHNVKPAPGNQGARRRSLGLRIARFNLIDSILA
jgi:hypothetical protein